MQNFVGSWTGHERTSNVSGMPCRAVDVVAACGAFTRQVLLMPPALPHSSSPLSALQGAR